MPCEEKQISSRILTVMAALTGFSVVVVVAVVVKNGGADVVVILSAPSAPLLLLLLPPLLCGGVGVGGKGRGFKGGYMSVGNTVSPTSI